MLKKVSNEMGIPRKRADKVMEETAKLYLVPDLSIRENTTTTLQECMREVSTGVSLERSSVLKGNTTPARNRVQKKSMHGASWRGSDGA